MLFRPAMWAAQDWSEKCLVAGLGASVSETVGGTKYRSTQVSTLHLLGWPATHVEDR
jgi:hypothetical protein